MGDWKRKPGLVEPQYFHLENRKQYELLELLLVNYCIQSG